MAFLQINYYSESLGMDQVMNVILPEPSIDTPDWTPKTMKDIPVLYLLHGMYGNHSIWQRKTRVERLVKNTKLAVVMPSTENAWYTNTKSGYNYFDALAIELPKKIHELFPQTSTKREKNFVCGLSMGGYGAWKFSLATNQFSHAASLSGALEFSEEMLHDHGSESYWNGIFGDLSKMKDSPENLFNLAKKKAKQKNLPKLYAWCGKEDFLYKANNHAVREFKKLGYSVKYEKDHGKHEWYYWDIMLERVLKWLPIDYQKEERLC